MFRYHYLVFSFMQDEETELELPFTDEELQVSLSTFCYLFGTTVLFAVFWIQAFARYDIKM